MKWFLQQQRLSEDLYAVIFFSWDWRKKREASNQTCTLTGWLKEMLHLLLQASIFPSCKMGK